MFCLLQIGHKGDRAIIHLLNAKCSIAQNLKRRRKNIECSLLMSEDQPPHMWELVFV